ncbi:MAG: BF3164 family lipoprotein [Gemmatimonadetes bacterium]|nr:BF3164 family lipoprotein [Gemmatimonadota bacterium]
MIQAVGNRLFVGDAAGDPDLHILDAYGGDLIVSLGRRGEGPGEFAGPIVGLAVVRPDTMAVWVYDGFKFMRVDESRTLNAETPTITPQEAPFLARATWLDSLTIVGVRRELEERFVFFDIAGERIATVPGALLGGDTIPMTERVRASINFALCARMEAPGFALAYWDAGRVELYDHKAGRPVVADVPYPSEPDFTRVRGEMRFRMGRHHYTECSASNDYVYALYSGQTSLGQTTDADEVSHGQEVHVFDWEGQYVGKLHLDTPMFGLSVDEQAGWLYGTSLLDAGVYRFRLPTPGMP